MDIYYLYPYIGDGRLAVAVTLGEDKTYALAGWALCSPKDQFRRDRAREIAGGRLHQGSLFDPRRKDRFFARVSLEPAMRREEINKAILFAIVERNLPSWARGLVIFENATEPIAVVARS